MNPSDEIQRARKELRLRMERLKRMYGRVMELSESGGKSAVIAYLAEEFDADPIEQGNNVLIGSYLFLFDSDGNFQSMESDPNWPTIAIAVKKPPPDSNNSGDT